MKSVLFVCKYNVGRSQMAAGLFNKYATDGHADSAGTQVDAPGETIADRASYVDAANNVIDVMKEEGVDISQCVRTQISKEMMPNYEKIIVMAEPETIPSWLSDAEGYEYWEIADPRGKGYEETKITRDLIKDKVIEFIERQKS